MIVLGASFSFIVSGQDSISVLFIGNSYTASNNLPSMVNQVANSFGDEIYYLAQTPGGATFETHASNTSTYTNIMSQNWDYVVIQAQSQEPSFPDNQVDQNTIPYAMQMADSVYAHYFCSDVNMFMTWGRKDGDPQWAPISTFEGMNGRLRSAYMRMADSVQGSVTPVGSAWAYIRSQHPSLGDSLYISDGSHPSVAGSYLAACTFYASLFRKNPIGSNYNAGLTGTQAYLLQTAAAMTVLDSLEQWNLRPISDHTTADFISTINSNTADFQNLSEKAQTYLWDFGDGNVSTMKHPSHAYISNGNYPVTLIAMSECDSDTLVQQIVINSLGVKDLQLIALGESKYSHELLKENAQVLLMNMQGQQMSLSISNSIIDLTGFASGMYFLVLEQSGVASIGKFYYPGY